MINIFYETNYAKRKKKIFTFKFQKSVLLNKYIDFSYKYNLIIPDRFITNGPLKLMNNVIRSLKFEKTSYNKIKYKNNYILQFDKFGEDALQKIIENNIKNSKVLVGPLYTVKQLENLVKYVNSYEFIRIVTASKIAKYNILNDLNLDIDESKFCTLPIGLIEKQKLIYNLKIKTRNERCLVYFKNRENSELEQVLEFLETKRIKYDLLQYGNYLNSKLKKLSKKNKFGVVIGSTESQGFAIQEMLLSNLPLIIWDKNIGNFEEYQINGTTVPYWNDLCGIKVDSIDALINSFEFFINNLNKYKPVSLISEQLTFDKFRENLICAFDEIEIDKA